jgi:hypothetical protein
MSIIAWWVRLSEPLLCKLGFHKWRNYGDEIVISWKEPAYVKARGAGGSKIWLESHQEAVFEGRECKRCGVKLRRKLVENSDGTLSCVGWEPDTEETGKE